MMCPRMNFQCIRAAAWFVLAVLLATPAGATTLQLMSLAKMAQAAPLIVQAQCVANSVALDAGEIWTFTSFRVEDTWRGNARPQITVRLLGGTMGDITSHVAGVPRFRPGEEVVLLLEPTHHGDWSVVSWEQGTFRIRRDASHSRALVTQDTASFATFDPVTRRFRATGVRNMPLQALHGQIEAALQTAGIPRP